LAFSVVLVDDDPAFLALAARILAGLDVAVAGTAADAREALALVRETRPDAVLLDIGLPDRNGIDLGYELAALPWAPRIVLISSDRDAELAIGSRPERAPPRFLAKEELDLEALRRALID
jgi:DNA-binding NarL/FixJ family response regulator